MLYNYEGKEVERLEHFRQNVITQKLFDSTSSTSYHLTRVYQKRIDGTKQCPFVRYIYPNSVSIYDLVMSEGWLFALNGANNRQYSVQDGEVVGAKVAHNRPPLAIYTDGTMGILENMQDWTVAPEGVVSALIGWVPLIVDYDDCTDYDHFIVEEGYETVITDPSQRQIIGQYANGDYVIITSEGRNYDNSVGFTFADARRVCKEHNIKFAYMLDGGGSVQTVLGQKNLNLVYENQTGREIMQAICFNGHDTFGIPNQS